MLISEEAVLASKHKKAQVKQLATKVIDDEIALKLKDLKTSADTQPKEPKEPKDKLLMLKGKGEKGRKGKGKGKRTWNDTDQWQPKWDSPKWDSPGDSSSAQYPNWNPPAQGKGQRTKADPSTHWCDIHQAHGHSTEWCFDNPYRTGGKPLPNDRPWCNSCSTYGQTTEACWGNNIQPASKGKGKASTSKGLGGKGNSGNRRWKSQNFPAAYSSEQATPALHDESPPTKSAGWWDDNELSSVCLDELTVDGQDHDPHSEYNDENIAAEIDLYFLAILKNMERQRDYLETPTAEKLHIINAHEGFISTSFNALNVHSQRIISTFKIQIGYEGCMDTLITRYPLRTNETQPVYATKPQIDTAVETKLTSVE